MVEQDQPSRTLEAHFEGQPFQQHASRWDSLWEDKWTPWDRGGLSLALSDLLEQKPELFDLPTEGTRKTALVPGCGRGHDVLLLAAFGFDAFGMDVSEKAVNEARKNAESVKGDEVFKPRRGRAGSCHWIAGDFFKDEWVRDTGIEGGKFDFIFDYTFCCALPPSARPAWARRMVDLLGPDGRLVCLEFPSNKQSWQSGPPWALPPYAYVAYLARPGEDVATDEHGGVLEDKVPQPREGGLKRLLHMKPPRTHAAGMKDSEVDDCISVWSH
ncbi:S-adenosyl-L-methionine-dependent methyltransferase [Xylariales sp. AK1849]|nr:S-adenosyl-L-methionine-dependent methyltransferase [Xylariales sp. AK1849]